MEWIRFWIAALLLGLAILAMVSAVVGNKKFGFILNRIHAAGIGDTAALFLAALAVIIGVAEVFPCLKIALVVVFMWGTSPVATHFLGQIEYYMNPDLSEHLRKEEIHDNN